MSDPSRGLLTPTAPRPASPASPPRHGGTSWAAAGEGPGWTATAPRARVAGDPGRQIRSRSGSRLPPSPFAAEPLTAPARRAQRVARDLHHGQEARCGGAMFEHVQRVALQVPPSARAVAFLHDACERSGVWAGELAIRLDLDEDETEALVLLTKRSRESLVRHVRRVARAPRGPARELALLVLAADLADHAVRAPGGADRYAAARAVVDEAQAGLGVG